MKRKRLTEITALVLTVVLLAVGLYGAGTALMPERYEYGAVWSTYLQEQRDTVDVMFFGSSLAYCDIVPPRIYEQTGLTGYVMAGPVQPLPISVEYLKESCKTQSPKLVFLEITNVFETEYTEYELVNVCYMPFGLERLRAARWCQKDTRISAWFPLYGFHNAIFEQEDKKDLQYAAYMECGYTLLTEAEAQTAVTDREYASLSGSAVYQRNVEAVQQFAAYCRENNIRLVLYFAPATAQIPAVQRQQLMADLRDTPCEAIEDWSDLSGSIGIDNAADWYDERHFNCNGAEKFTDYLSSYLLTKNLTPGDTEDKTLWQQRVAWWQTQRAGE